MKRNSVFTKLLAMLLCVMMVIGCLPISAFADQWEGDIDVVEDPEGSETNPIDLTSDLLYEDDFSATVTVPAGETFYYIAYRVGGMIMTINDGEGVTCVTNGMMMPYAWTISNDGAEAAEYVIKVSYPEGSSMNPAELVIGENTATVETGAQGYFYTWTAAGEGTLTITMPEGNWSYAINNLTTGVYGDTQWSDSDPVVNPATITVAEGDEIEIVVNTYDPADMFSAPAGSIVFTAEFEYTAGSEQNPIDLTSDLLYEDDFSATVTVPAGETLYYIAYRVGGMIMTINDGEGVTCVTNGMMMPYAWTISNDGAEAAEYVIKVSYPEGNSMNPAELVIGENSATIEAGAQGYFYTWTAEEEGTLTITMPEGNWSYAINNLTTGVYGDTQWSDSDPVVNPGTVEVAAGDEIQVVVNTYDPADMFSTPAGTVTFTAEFAAAGTISLSLPACNFVGAVEIIHYVKIEGFENLSQEYIMENSGVLIWEEEIADEAAVFGSTDRYTTGMKYEPYYGEYYGATDGIPAAEYYIPLHIRAYLKLENGKYVYGPMMTYSVQQYCEEQIAKTKNEAQKNLCIATLHFGAAAQIRFNKGVDTLANANIVDTYPLPEYDASWIGALGTPNSSLPVSDKITRTATPANVVGAVQLQYCVQTTVANVAKAELLYWYNTTEELTEANATVVTMDWDDYYKEYAAFTQGIPAAEYGYSVYMTAKITDADGNVYYGEIFTYGIDAYADYQYNRTGVSEAQKNLCHAMAYFGEMAKIRFGK